MLIKEAHELYGSREAAFTPEIMRKVEHDIYLQILDNLWMQHLENMDHLKEGIHWMSVGQRDPLVEYRRRAQVLFDEMQAELRHQVVRTLFHAQPVTESQLEQPIETELTRAARGSINNADKIVEATTEFEAADFDTSSARASTPVKKQASVRKKARKAERQRRAKARKRK